MLTSSTKLSYYRFNSIQNESMTTSLTNISSLSILKMNLKQTCSCSTCTCSNDSKIKSNYFENNNNYLTYTFITLYESLIWCIQTIYELFFKSLWQILIYIKQELQYNQNNNKTISMISINNSASENYPLICKKKLSTLNRQRHYRLRKKDSSSIDTHIVIVPVRSSHCQTDISKNDLQTININLNQSEKNINLHNTFCRRLHEPLIFINREIYYQHNRTSFFPTSRQNFSQQQSTHEKMEFSLYKQLSFNEDANKIVYSANRNNKLSTINTDLSLTTSRLPVSNILNESSSHFLPNSTNKTSFSKKNSHTFHQRKSKQKQRIIDDNSIPLALATSLHSNISLYNEDYFLTKYIHQLFIDKHHFQ